MRPIIVLLSVSFLVINGCKKDENPASAAADSYSVTVAGNLVNTNFQSTILGAELQFDNSAMSSASFSSGNWAASLAGVLTSVNKGQHTIAFKITGQTSSPNTYTARDVSVVIGSGTGATNRQLADQTKSLATGETISYSISVP
jgi:PBP1b-binding outer membrane lipoprotein LpoB